MTSLPRRGLVAAALATAILGLSTTALVQASALHPTTSPSAPTAQAAAPAAPKAGPGEQKRAERIARLQQRMAERQAAFKAELQLTPEQEPAWHAFVARTQPQARPARQGTREDWAQLTTPQRLDRMQALKAERDAAMLQRTDAIKSFYAALSAEQQKVFDSKFRMGPQRVGMQRHSGKHPDHRHHHRGVQRGTI